MINLAPLRVHFKVEDTFPLRIEPLHQGKSFEFLMEYLQQNDKYMQSLLLTKAAILFRGFDACNETDYQDFYNILTQGKSMDNLADTGPGQEKVTRNIVKVSPIP